MAQNKYNIEFLANAHKQSIFHIKEISKSNRCGCFYCQFTFNTNEIKDWTDEDDERGKTALCPKCNIDSVLSDDFPIDDKDFLKEMNKKYFG